MSVLIRSTTSPELATQHWVPTKDSNIYLGDGAVPVPSGAVIIAVDGVVISEVEYLAIRPLGNAAGVATAALRYQHFMDEPQLLINPVATDPITRVYPADNLPFAIELRHKEFTGNANPEWDGWGWRAEIVGGASSRDPSARAIGIYSDEACTAYLYTTGAFTQQQSAWQVDEQNQPLTVWATEYNPGLLGYPNDTKQPVYHACLLGSVQEGYATLWPTQESAYHEFWLHDQGYVAPPSATWVDTGATIVAITAANVYQVNSIIVGLTVGQAIRIGDVATGERIFNGYWPTTGTPSTYIKTTVHYAGATAGMKVWKWA